MKTLHGLFSGSMLNENREPSGVAENLWRAWEVTKEYGEASGMKLNAPKTKCAATNEETEDAIEEKFASIELACTDEFFGWKEL